MFYVYLLESIATEGQRYVAFSDHAKAIAFENCLKSGSGHAFASKRLW